ncbi:MAG: dihydropteroate synthase [Candidatus Dadabacteria bacterium]
MYTLNCKGRLVTISEPIVMGILNLTPDSFYEGSRLSSLEDALKRAAMMIEQGATILDIGGQSTRPGSELVNAEEERKRVIPVIDAIHKRFPDQLISIDTFYAVVAKDAVSAGAHIVNDVSAGNMDEELIPTVINLQVPYVLMHMKGKPLTMQQNPQYKNVTLEVFDFLQQKISELTKSGIKEIILDPGFGFGKGASHNFQLLKNMFFLQQLNKPIMVGLSRKATIYKTLGITAMEALNGTTVMNTIALLNGANILRVHDVKAAREAITLVKAYQEA